MAIEMEERVARRKGLIVERFVLTFSCCTNANRKMNSRKQVPNQKQIT